MRKQTVINWLRLSCKWTLAVAEVCHHSEHMFACLLLCFMIVACNNVAKFSFAHRFRARVWRTPK